MLMPTALIVEDEPEANKLLALLLQLRGYSTESAFTGGEAIEKLGTNPDVVFLDLMLPDTTGFDVCRAIKTRRETNPIPVVMVTARLAAENRAQSFRVGANDFVPKPYTPDQIFDALKAADVWRREMEAHGTHGEVHLHTRADGSPFAALARLWSLLLARTSWDEGEIRQLGLLLVEIGQEAIDWGRRNDVADIATLSYEILSESLRLTLRDHASWFASENDRLDELIAMGGFDSIERDPSEGRIRLTRSFPPERNS
jgi:CheY-like chemotaxis protein